MAEKIQLFELPRVDWYDAEGRIYKDIIIENLNAIEAKLLEMANLSAFETEIPDLSTIEYPDTNLASNDNQIVNLRSFLNMTNLINYPIECSFSGSIAKKVAYWGSDMSYHTILDVDSEASNSRPYIYLDYGQATVISSSSSNTPVNCVFIGCYTNGVVKCVNSTDFANINLLYYLSKMSIDTWVTTAVNNESTRETNTTWKSLDYSGRAIGTWKMQLGGVGNGATMDLVFKTLGRKGK
jgi:hypothetical protein